MDKKSVMYAAGALVIILVFALVIKPMVTGQPLNTGLPIASTPQPPASFPQSPTATETPAQTFPTTTPPVVVPTWDRNVMTIGFVDPSTYGITLGNPLPNGSRFDPNPVNTSTTPYAKISGKYSGTTGIIKIPFPYWEIVYTVDPVTATEPGSVQVIPTGGGAPHSGVQGSYSGVIPEFTVQVIDAEDPNRIVRTFSPPGGINLDLWETNDPRPWTEKFYEGQKSYYFIITSKLLNSYNIDIRIPTKYISRY
jgi:hypothetical protein